MVVTVEITGMLEELLDALVAAGLYNNKSEVVRDAIRRLGEKVDLNHIAFTVYSKNREMTFTRALGVSKLGFKEAVTYFIKHGFAPELGVSDPEELSDRFYITDTIENTGKEVILDLTSLEIYMETGFIEFLPKLESFISFVVPKSLEEYLRQIPLRYGFLYKKLLRLPGFTVEKAAVSTGMKGWLATNEAEAIKIAKQKNIPITSCDIRFRKSARLKGVKTLPGIQLVILAMKKGIVSKGFWSIFLARASAIPIYLPEGVEKIV